MGEQIKKEKILIADDSEMNRELLIEMLEEQFDILEAENGRQAVEILAEQSGEVSLLLLDLVMPEMDGFEVLAFMNTYHWIEEIPVIVISAETAPAFIDRAYDFGVTDFIARPFNMAVVHHRVENALMLFAKERKMTGIIASQIYKNKQDNWLMISILSHVMEFRNGESGFHVLHIHTITSLLLRQLRQKDGYAFDAETADRITTASSLHDIGKISISSEILNKPGKLTPEEFEIMKSHSLQGAKMLESLSKEQWETPFVKTAYEICRWHHERYDGRGYPDGLKGDDIPISAQVVALADVYDALTSERCYKKAFSHETAIQMIVDGQCGAFNPVLLECLQDIAGVLREALELNFFDREGEEEVQSVVDQIHDDGLMFPDRLVEQNAFWQQKVQFLLGESRESFFFYSVVPPLMTLNAYGAEQLGVKEMLCNPLQEGQLEQWFAEGAETLRQKMAAATADMPDFCCPVTAVAGQQSFTCTCHTVWLSEGCQGMIGKLTAADGASLPHDAAKRLCQLEQAVSQAACGDLHVQIPSEGEDEIGRLAKAFRRMTELLNRNLNDLNDRVYQDAMTSVKNRAAYQRDVGRLADKIADGDCRFAVAVLDGNNLKDINNTYGHDIGDELIVRSCQIICSVFLHSPVYRIGGDEFVVLLENGDLENSETLVAEFRRRMVEVDCRNGKVFKMPLSLGFAVYDPATDTSFDDVFRRADALMYQNKVKIKAAYPLPAADTAGGHTEKEAEK